MQTVAFIGLGNMGGPMAENLLKHNFKVRAFDLMPDNVNRLADKGAYAAQSASDCALGADIIITMLPSGKHVAELFFGDQGLIQQASPNTLIIDSSTIDAETSRALHARAIEADLLALDAPVSGGVAAASAGTLSFMCGGTKAAFDRAHDALQAMGKNLFLAGPAGAGQVAKMCNNMLLAIHMIGTCEALNLGATNGLDPKILSQIMQASSGSNWSLEKYNPAPGVMEGAPASNNYQPGFMVDLMCKDLGLALDNAKATASNTPLGQTAQSLYEIIQSQGQGSRDFSSIMELIASANLTDALPESADAI